MSTNSAFYEAVARQTTREWAVVVKLADGTPHVIAAYTVMSEAVNASCDLNQRGDGQTFVIYVQQP